MKVKHWTFLGILIISIISSITSQYQFVLISALALAPTVILYPNLSLDELHNDKRSYSGLRLMFHPIILFFLLTFTHHAWIDFFRI